MNQLRPLLIAEEFVGRIQTQQAEGYQLAFLEDEGAVVAVAGFRLQTLLWSGRTLYVDDLVTDSNRRSQGHGGEMLDWLIALAREAGCTTFMLDSGTHRNEAHAFYFAMVSASLIPLQAPSVDDRVHSLTVAFAANVLRFGYAAKSSFRGERTASPTDNRTDCSSARAISCEHDRAMVLEDGKALFDMREAKYKLATEHGRCTLHLWGEGRNLVRRVSGTTMRNGALRLTTHRFGQTKPQTLELVADRDRRTPSTREATRVKYLRVLERVLLRSFPGVKTDAFRTAMDLEKSFGPAYARGSLVRGSQAWAVIGVNEEETQTTVDGILTLGILWLQHCRESGDGRRLYQGLKLIVPRGMAMLTLSRMAWLNRTSRSGSCGSWTKRTKSWSNAMRQTTAI